MNRLHDVAQLLVSCWSLSGKDQDDDNLIPTSHSILDRALKDLADRNELPRWVLDEIHFVDSRIGLQCIELPTILDWAQKAELTSAPNPSYQVTQVQIRKPTAKKLLWRLGVSDDKASEWGKLLRDAVERLGASGIARAAELRV
jgi:hypothetical protein